MRDLGPYATGERPGFLDGMAWGQPSACGHWRIEPAGDAVLVTAVPPERPAADHLWQPRVRPKVGVGVPLARVASLVDAITATVPSSPGANSWSKPGLDHTEGFAYVQGPVDALEEVNGWQPMARFVVARHDLFHLGRLLSALVARA